MLEIRGGSEMDKLEKEVAESIARFVASDYGRGFLLGMQTAIDVMVKQIPVPTDDTGKN